MRLVEAYVRKPHLLLSFVLLLAVVGVVGYRKMPVSLFPDSERPQIAVVTSWPGASADDVSSDVSRVIEKELKTIELVRRVTSTSNDEASVVTVEFEYQKGLDSAATDVTNSLNKIRPLLPADIRPFQVHKVSSATPPVMTVALSPRENSHLDLSMVRQLADNPIKEALLRVPGVDNVEVFGGYQPVVRVTLDPDRLQAFRLTAAQVAGALNTWNRNTPEGLLATDARHILLKNQGAFQRVDELAGVVVSAGAGAPVYLRDVATVERSVQERLSAYHGNGKAAIGLNIQRSLSGHSLPTINTVLAALPRLEQQYPGLRFEIADTQEELIKGSVDNMVDALRDAIIMTVAVIFLFLADLRGMVLAAVSIPFTYLLTFAAMWLLGFQFDMVTLTGVIVGVGMLLDDAIVVIENIERHYRTLGKDLSAAVIGGTQEVMLAVLSGTYATVVVLVPIIFIGGFVQTVLRPLALTLGIALVASYVVSVTILPILAPTLLRLGRRVERSRWELALDRFVGGRLLHPVQEFFVGAAQFAQRHKGVFLLAAGLLLALSGRVLMPLVGRDLMPPMDTGIFRISFEAYPNTSLSKAEALLAEVERVVWDQPGVVRSSAMLGSEPGLLSFGSGRNPQQAFITVHLRDRFHRPASLWDVERAVQERVQRIAGIRFPAVYDYGATPLSTIRSTVDVMLSGPDPRVLDRLARQVDERLHRVGGLKAVVRTWSLDRLEYRFVPDANRLALYGLDAANVAAQVSAQVKGTPATLMRVPQQDSFAVWVQARRDRRDSHLDLATLPIQTPRGPAPLSALGQVLTAVVPTLHTRQGLEETVDVLGFRSTTATTHIDGNVEAALRGLQLPPGYALHHEGERKAMEESFAALMSALLLGLVLLYFSLVPAFRSFIHPLTIMVAIPLGLIGATWSMLLAGKHSSMPAFMGMILLAGIVVKNSILLIDFVEQARATGASLAEAVAGAVRTRTRPILMTAMGTAVGMLPIALEWAIGLERLSGLAVVAIGGLLVSTLLTLVYVPLFYDLFDGLGGRLRRGLRRPAAAGVAIFALVAWPQPAGAEPTLTLEQALHTAITNQPQMRAAQGQASAAAERIGQARAAYLPRLDAQAFYQRSTADFMVTPQLVHTPLTKNYQARNDLGDTVNYVLVGATATQLIYDFGRTPGAVAQAQAASEASRAEAEATTQAVTVNVKAEYYRVLAAKELVQVAEDTARNQSQHVEQIRRMLAAGARPRFDLTSAELNQANAELVLVRARNALASAKVRLNVAMGVESSTAYDVVAPAPEPTLIEDEATDALVQLAIQRRPELARAAAQLRLREAQRRSAAAGYWPSLNAVGSFTGAKTATFDAGYNWYVGVGISWNLFGGFATQRQIDEAQANLDAASAQRDGVRQAIRAEIEEQLLAVAEAKQLLVVAAQAEATANERLRLAENRYQTGGGTVLELDDAQLTLASARAQQVRARYDLATARVRLERAAGL